MKPEAFIWNDEPPYQAPQAPAPIDGSATLPTRCRPERANAVDRAMGRRETAAATTLARHHLDAVHAIIKAQPMTSTELGRAYPSLRGGSLLSALHALEDEGRAVRLATRKTRGAPVVWGAA